MSFLSTSLSPVARPVELALRSFAKLAANIRYLSPDTGDVQAGSTTNIKVKIQN